MKAAAELALVLGVATLGAVGTWKIAGPPSRQIPCDPAALAPEEICLTTVLADWEKGSFLWIDARPPAEWERDGIPGSISLTTAGGPAFDAQVEAALEHLATASRALVYCGSSDCGVSKEVVHRLNALGLIPEVRALHGGWDALVQAGLP